MDNDSVFHKNFKKLCLSIDERKYRQEIYDAYFEALQAYADEEITYAVSWLVRNFIPSPYKPFPVVAEIIRCIKEKREDDRRRETIFSADDLPKDKPDMKRIKEMIDNLARKVELRRKRNDGEGHTGE